MTKTEFLSASLPYKIHLSRDGKKDGGRLRDIRVSNVIGLNGCRLPDRYNVRVGSKSIYYNNIEDYIPIVRPLSDLTKECVQADYNNGNPFIPIVELAKIAFQKLKWDIGFENGRCYLLYSGGAMAYEFTFSIETLSFYCLRCRTSEACAVPYQSELFQLMYKFHFDLITEDCEKIYVTDEFNPYK